MAYRKFDTSTWRDPWFEELGLREKLAFIYFWTNEICNQAGIYEISEKRIKFELGYGIDMVFEGLKEKIQWYSGSKTIWVKNFFRRQCQNSKFAISALNSIKEDPEKLQIFIEYNKKILEGYKIDLDKYLHTISIPYPTETETETDTEAVTDTDFRQIEKFCADFIKHIKKTKPTLSPISDSLQKNSHVVVNQLISLDGFTLDEIITTMQWAVKDDFWQDNIFSLAALRKKSGNGLTKFQNIRNSMVKSSKQQSKSKLNDKNKEAGRKFIERMNRKREQTS